MSLNRKVKNIVFCGEIGTGTSSAAKEFVRRHPNWIFVSAGGFFRQWYKDHSIPIEEVDKLPDEVDRQIDYGLRDRLKSESRLAVESRVQGFLCKDFNEVAKVLLICDLDESMKRVAQRDNMSVEEATRKSKLRSQGFQRKMRRVYGVSNVLDSSYFELIIGTTLTSGL